MPERIKVVAYLRVSTDNQAELGVSLEAQRAKVTGHAALYDVELVDVLVDTGSARTLDRKALRDALERLDRGTVQGRRGE